MRKHIITAIMSSLLILLTACASAATPPADEIATQLQAALELPMHGIMEESIPMPDGSEETRVMERWQNGSRQMRTVTLEGPEGIAGSINVHNGNETWSYHPDDNTYTHIELSEMPSEEEMGGRMTQMMEQMLESMEVTYLGSGKVAERNTHEVKLTPKEGAENGFIPGEITISADSETWHPLKMEIESEQFGTMKMQYREIEFNPNFPPDIFTFVPPEGAEEVEMEMPEMQELTLEEAREKAPFKLLEPTSLPEGLEFESAQLFEQPENEQMSGTSVTLNYKNGIEQLTINQFYSPEADDFPMSMEGREKVSVRGQEGYSMEMGMGMRGLSWSEGSEGELWIHIYGSLSEEEMLKVAESLEGIK